MLFLYFDENLRLIWLVGLDFFGLNLNRLIITFKKYASFAEFLSVKLQFLECFFLPK